MTILHIDSSIAGDNSVSRILSQSVVDRLKAQHPGAKILRRDLAAQSLPHLTLEALGDHSVVDEFLAADTVVIGAPMYNFGIPSQLKAWIDRIAIAGKTFRYTEKGPIGLAGGRKVIIASSRGGFYGPDTPMSSLDHQENYLRGIFAFIGVTDVTFVRAEGVAVSADSRAKAIEVAKSDAARIAA